jgi:hypothetical protein
MANMLSDDVIRRLEAFGREVAEAEKQTIDFVIGKVTRTIENACNTDGIPDGLYYVAVDMACGEFLFAERGSGRLADLDVETAIKSIKEGDTQITYAIPDTSITLDGLIDALRNCGRSQFAAYRRFVW